MKAIKLHIFTGRWKLLTTIAQTLDWLKPEGWKCLKLHLDATSPRTVPMLIMPCSLNTINLLTTPSMVGHTVVGVLAHRGLLCLAKQLKLLFFYLTQTSASVFLFGIGEQRPSLDNYSSWTAVAPRWLKLLTVWIERRCKESAEM